MPDERYVPCLMCLADGGGVDCAKKIFDKTGVSNYRQVKVAGLGITNDGEPVTDERVEVVMHRIKDELAAT